MIVKDCGSICALVPPVDVSSGSTEQPDDASQSSQPAPPKKRRTSLFSYDTSSTPKQPDSSTSATTTDGTAPVLTYIDFVSSGKASSLKEIADRDQFKTLHKLFERVFCTPATSAPVERVFSHGGIFMKPHRARMGDKVLSDLVFVKCNKHM